MLLHTARQGLSLKKHIIYSVRKSNTSGGKTDFVCVGDIVVKKTRVVLGFIVESIQFAHVFKAIR